ncbi:hypothetical protein [Paraburkholderia sp. ZP32-5]|uniref:hypothetical protein n=1 Tax=Paraburkholderia sp. ZP32-5 TaxID=2883245 RepID=UPI001F1D153A|nr:hypothetical protein [Paraburkholderia sp. ZP32-5]
MSSAQASGKLADKAQANFRTEHANLNTAHDTRDEAAGHTAAKNMFRTAGSVVIHRNNELKNLSAFTVSADVTTPKNGAVFWSGDQRDAKGNVTASAMNTAHAFARKNGGAAVEQTEGGKRLENYAGHGQSFGYLANRFEYTAETDRDAAQSTREALLMKGAAMANTSIRNEMGPALHDRLTTKDANGKEFTPAGRPHSAAGAMWDTLSVRYARQAEGNVNVIHAASKDDPYFSGDRFKSSTWNQRERPTLESGGKTTIKEHFAEDLRGQLEGPAKDVPDYKGTGGFKGNLGE